MDEKKVGSFKGEKLEEEGELRRKCMRNMIGIIIIIL